MNRILIIFLFSHYLKSVFQISLRQNDRWPWLSLHLIWIFYKVIMLVHYVVYGRHLPRLPSGISCFLRTTSSRPYHQTTFSQLFACGCNFKIPRNQNQYTPTYWFCHIWSPKINSRNPLYNKPSDLLQGNTPGLRKTSNSRISRSWQRWAGT